MVGRVVLLLLLLLALVDAPRPTTADEADIERRKQELVLRLRIHRAIDTGAVWVAGQQGADGGFGQRFGESALATYTLAHCGYTPDRVEIKKAVGYLRKHYRQVMKGDYLQQASSYSLSLTVLALHTLYGCSPPGWARGMVERILDWLLENQAPGGLFRYPGGLPGPGRMGGAGPEDMSNTQYVLLALWAGVQCGYRIEQDVLEKIATRLLAWQETQGPRAPRRLDPQPTPEGPDARYGNVREPPARTDYARGFGYTPDEAPTGSMTTAGLSSLAIVKAMLQEQEMLDAALERRLDQAIWDAIAWLTWRYSIRQNPPSSGPTWHYYYLYGLERACVIVGKRYLGDHDWYVEGARLLVGAQAEDGRWSPQTPRRSGPPGVPPGRGGLGGVGGPRRAGRDAGTDLLDTCFALLFLKRAALPPKAPLLPQPAITPSESAPESPR